MVCVGDGWHKVHNFRVLVENRVIVKCIQLMPSGELKEVHIKRWDFMYHTYRRCGMVTLAAFRSGLNRSTMTAS